MSLTQSPHLTAIAARQHQQELRREATRWHAASRAATPSITYPGAANHRQAGTVSRRAVSWQTRVACWLRAPLPARPTRIAEAGSQS